MRVVKFGWFGLVWRMTTSERFWGLRPQLVMVNIVVSVWSTFSSHRTLSLFFTNFMYWIHIIFHIFWTKINFATCFWKILLNTVATVWSPQTIISMHILFQNFCRKGILKWQLKLKPIKKEKGKDRISFIDFKPKCRKMSILRSFQLVAKPK